MYIDRIPMEIHTSCPLFSSNNTITKASRSVPVEKRKTSDLSLALICFPLFLLYYFLRMKKGSILSDVGIFTNIFFDSQKRHLEIL